MITKDNLLTDEQTAEVLYQAIKLCLKYPKNYYKSACPGGRCSYNGGTNSESPEHGCLVGQAARKIGLKFGTEINIHHLVSDSSSEHTQALKILQYAQDNGYSWKQTLGFIERRFG